MNSIKKTFLKKFSVEFKNLMLIQGLFAQPA